MAALDPYRRLLRNGPLTRLLAGEFISSIGDWLYLVALMLLVYQETQSEFVLGIVGAVRMLPYVFLTAVAGVAADRYDRRLILLSTDVVRGLLMVAMALCSFLDLGVLPIVILAVAATCFSTFFAPTIAAFLPNVVGDERDLGPANSAWSTLDNIAFVIGPVVAGILVGLGGFTIAFLLNAATFAVIAAILLGLPAGLGRRSHDAAEATRTGGTDGTRSVRALLGDRLLPLVGLGVIDTVGSFVFGGLAVLTVVLAVSVLGAGEEGTGYLNAAVGVGGIAGALTSGVLVLRRSLAGPLILGGLVLAAGLVGLGVFTDLAPALVAMAVAAFGVLVLEVVGMTVFQMLVPDELRGRAYGLIRTFSMLAYSLGSFALPVLAGGLGVTPVLVGAAAGIVLATVACVLLVGASARRSPTALEEAVARAAGLPIFTGVPERRLRAAARRFRSIDVVPGQVVIRQGDPADAFYVIVRGSFRVSQVEGAGAEARVLRTLGPDEVFGELGILRRAPRSATVTAEAEGRLLALDGPAFLDLVSASSDVASRFEGLWGSAGPSPR